MTEDILLKLAAILVLGVLSQWLAWRAHIPSILILLLAGFAVGPITGLIDPDELLGELFLPLVGLSVAIILFEGGLSLKFSDLPHAGRVITRLIIVGGAITAAATALAAHLIVGLDAEVSIVLGAILIVTGPTVIIPLLEQVKPSGRVSAILRWEGIVIDPVGAVLALLVYEALLVGDTEQATVHALSSLVQTLAAGGLIGAAAGGLIAFLFARYLVPDSLQNPMTMAFVVAAYTLSNEIQEESGLLATVVMGLVLANQRFVTVRHIVHFKESIRVLLLAGLFIVLAARLSIDELEDAVSLESLAFLAVVIVFIRPAAVFLSTIGTPLTWQERVFVAWMAPRGIVAASVASVFSLRLLAEGGNEDAAMLVPLTFLVIVGTITVYGLSAGPLAQRLGLAARKLKGLIIVGGQSWAREIATVLKAQGVDVMLIDSNRDNVRLARLAGLQAVQANILAEYTPSELDLTGIGALLAMTPNDEVNSLAVQRFADHFSRANVYQLAPKGASDSGPESITREQRGRILFGSGVSHQHIAELFERGASVKATNLTEQFGLEDLISEHGNVVPLFLINPGGDPVPLATDRRPTARAGQIVVSIIAPGGVTDIAEDEEELAAE